MSHHIESYYEKEPTRKMYYQIWTCESPIFNIFITHGMGEHSHCYDQLAKDLNKKNIQVFAWDLMGHGKSSGQRGYVNDFKDHCDDFKIMFNLYNSHQLANKQPVILLGHSMGATVTLRSYIEQLPKNASMICLSSPALKVNEKPNIIKETLAVFANKFLPRLTLDNNITDDKLSTVPAQLEFYKKDELRHSKVNPRTYFGMLSSFKIIFDNQEKIKIPISIMASKNDPLVDSSEAKRFYNLLSTQNKSFKYYKNSQHEIFNDKEREQVISDMLSFINIHLKNKPA